MEIQIISQGLNDPPVLLTRPHVQYLDYSYLDKMTMVVVEGGMASGAPSVIIVSDGPAGSILLQTSLEKFLMAAQAMGSMAETRFNWKLEEGSYSILPPDKETRRQLLESIKKELEEWDNADPDISP